MKILHTSDWHLGKRLNMFSRLPEQIEVMEEICEIAEKENVAAVLIAGDLFDTFNPSSEATELFYSTVKRLSDNGNRAVIAIAGNHDSPDRIEAPQPLAHQSGIIFIGYPDSYVKPFTLKNGLSVMRSEPGFIELVLPKQQYPLRLILTPYANEYRLKTFLGNNNREEELRELLQEKWQLLANTYCDNQGVNMLATHLFVIPKGDTPPAEPEDEKPILHAGGAQAVYTCNIPGQMQYVALGHLHRKQQTSSSPCPVVYSGSPLAYSFSEAQQQKKVILLDAQPGKEVVINEIALQKGRTLLKKKLNGTEQAIQWLTENPEALVEITIATETYLTGEERKAIHQAHNGIMAIIPEITDPETQELNVAASIDLSKNIEELFVTYFKSVKQETPNEEIMDLFKEIVAQGGEK